MTILLLQDMVEKTAAFAGAGVAVSALPAKNWTIKIQVESFDADETARLTIEDSVDNFVTPLGGPSISLLGGISKTADKVYHFNWYDYPALRVGVTDAKLRLNLTAISGGTLKYKAWIEYGE